MRVAILTVSDRSHRGLRPDTGGPSLVRVALENGWQLTATQIVPDEKESIKLVLLEWVNRGGVDLIFTTGGTGIGPRDVTPEATQEILDKNIPGLAELMRAEGLRKTPFSVLSRAVAGIRGKTLIVNLPGNPHGARESLELIAPLLVHAHAMVKGADHPFDSQKRLAQGKPDAFVVSEVEP